MKVGAWLALAATGWAGAAAADPRLDEAVYSPYVENHVLELEGRAGQENPADLWPRLKPRPRANLRDHDNLVGLRAPVALRDLELDSLSLF